MTVYHPQDLTKIVHLPQVRPLAYHPAGRRLYVAATKKTGELELQIRRGHDLALETTLPLPGLQIESSALKTRTNRLYLLIQTEQTPEDQSKTKRQLPAVDGQTLAITTQELNFSHGFYLQVDEATNQLYAIHDLTEWLVVNGQTLTIMGQHRRTDRCHNAFSLGRLVLDTEGQFLLTASGDTMLHRYDPTTGRAEPPLPLGRRMLAAIHHPDNGRLYILVSLGTLTMLAFLRSPGHRPFGSF